MSVFVFCVNLLHKLLFVIVVVCVFSRQGNMWKVKVAQGSYERLECSCVLWNVGLIMKDVFHINFT